jgi:hypothetical protein
MIEAEGLHLDDHMTRYLLGFGAFLDREDFGSAVLGDDDGFHILLRMRLDGDIVEAVCPLCSTSLRAFDVACAVETFCFASAPRAPSFAVP